MINGVNPLQNKPINPYDEIANKSNNTTSPVINMRNETTEESTCEEVYDMFLKETNIFERIHLFDLATVFKL